KDQLLGLINANCIVMEKQPSTIITLMDFLIESSDGFLPDQLSRLLFGRIVKIVKTIFFDCRIVFESIEMETVWINKSSYKIYLSDFEGATILPDDKPDAQLTLQLNDKNARMVRSLGSLLVRMICSEKPNVNFKIKPLKNNPISTLTQTFLKQCLNGKV